MRCMVRGDLISPLASATHWTRNNVHLVKHKLVSSSLSYTLVDNIGGLKSHHLRCHSECKGKKEGRKERRKHRAAKGEWRVCIIAEGGQVCME